jgi:hypothetical protein
LGVTHAWIAIRRCGANPTVTPIGLAVVYDLRTQIVAAQAVGRTVAERQPATLIGDSTYKPSPRGQPTLAIESAETTTTAATIR